MGFGQQSGPPASGKQVQELLELLHAAGHRDFRDARGPMGFTQRQANGKFTRDEAEQLIAELQAAAESEQGASDSAPPAPARRQPPRPTRTTRAAASGSALASVPSAELAAELQRRGWVVMEP